MNFKRVLGCTYPLLLVILTGVYPALYLYASNVSLLVLSSLWRAMLLCLALCVVVYIVFLALTRCDGIKAALSGSVIILLLCTYGIFYETMLKQELISIKHYTLLPFLILITAYLVWVANRLNRANALLFWRVVSVIFLGLVTIQVDKITPVELEKKKQEKPTVNSYPQTKQNANESYPDIYYLLFDEFSGFMPMREYYGTPEVEPFKAFLEEEDFFVAEESFSSSIWTVHQMASRLNYTNYPSVGIKDDIKAYADDFTDNSAMQLLSGLGYTTYVYEEVSMFVKSLPHFNADYYYSIYTENDAGFVLDDYDQLLIKNSVLNIFMHHFNFGDVKNQLHKNFIEFTKERNIAGENQDSPKFVYVHLAIPHNPYMYNRNGEKIDPNFYDDWDYYEGYWVYSTGIIKEFVKRILENSDPENPPVIILQSDHGVRLKTFRGEMTDFPEEFQYSILNALYLPGYDTSSLPQDLNPINTLPIVFNHYLGTDIPLK